MKAPLRLISIFDAWKLVQRVHIWKVKRSWKFQVSTSFRSLITMMWSDLSHPCQSACSHVNWLCIEEVHPISGSSTQSAPFPRNESLITAVLWDGYVLWQVNWVQNNEIFHSSPLPIGYMLTKVCYKQFSKKLQVAATPIRNKLDVWNFLHTFRRSTPIPTGKEKTWS